MKINRLVNTTDKISLDFFLTIKDNKLYKVIHQDYVIMGTRNYFSDLIYLNILISDEDKILESLQNSSRFRNQFSEESLKSIGIETLNQTFGEFYPRIFRPFPYTPYRHPHLNDRIDYVKGVIYEEIAFDPNDNNSIVNSVNQLYLLTQELKNILDTIRPESTNLKVYGNKIKNLLVLACIEVENQFKAIIRENDYNNKRQYTTKDYINLNPILRLSNYSIYFSYYPDLIIDNPFEDWDITIGATKSIKWYDSYNAVKHNSEKEINKATLEMAIQAISALAILIVAQFGYSPLYWKERLGNFYDINNNTIWESEDLIFAPLKLENWKWTPIKYKI